MPEALTDPQNAVNRPIEEKWGEALNTGFVVVPVALLRDQKSLTLDDGEMMVLINLLSFWWEPKDLPKPRTSTIAKRMGVTSRTVQRHLRELERKGLIGRLRDGTGVPGRRSTARYEFVGLVSRMQRDGKNFHPARREAIQARNN